ncbi:MAG TPA: bifunctional glutamate N-acetyltransferase/amino-acid acetyltransferase ArgJ [Lacipirellulaceae bacterium]|jgi:glutamate N-acetyltransferase/amino-acid N-acetyltransferase|nr:bifunctional glutamate N-acetyltransferase/amino-acid acetyltransferase ArgJ [Lacipirellulaceae bacterium]
MSLRLPQGFRAAGVYSGVKRNDTKLDLSLVVSDRPAVAAGVYTKNLVHAAPVKIDRERTPSDSIRVVAINSGVANACTGDQGDADARQMAAWAAEAVGAKPEQALIMSTGVIGQMLPMAKIQAGIQAASQKLGDDEQSLENAARGIMTTDTVPKLRGREVTIGGIPTRVTGIAKGAAMIGPNMATMLAIVMTDACLRKQDAQSALVDAMEESFHCISVDGHMSTNDTVILLANGAASYLDVSLRDANSRLSDVQPLSGKGLEDFRTTLFEVCEDLAQSIPADGEGATHLITVEVHGCRSRADALQIGKTIADSPLVKTAIAGADPNWGRVVSAAGYAGVQFDPAKVTLYINGLLLYERGAPVDFDADAVSNSIAGDRDTSIVLILEEGKSAARFWTTDLTAEYVRLNADYHT